MKSPLKNEKFPKYHASESPILYQKSHSETIWPSSFVCSSQLQPQKSQNLLFMKLVLHILPFFFNYDGTSTKTAGRSLILRSVYNFFRKLNNFLFNPCWVLESITLNYKLINIVISFLRNGYLMKNSVFLSPCFAKWPWTSVFVRFLQSWWLPHKPLGKNLPLLFLPLSILFAKTKSIYVIWPRKLFFWNFKFH